VGCLLLDESNLVFTVPHAPSAEGVESAGGGDAQQASITNVMELFNAMDVSKDGKVDYKEFETFYLAVMMNSASRTLAPAT
jgi:hypothetical protein